MSSCGKEQPTDSSYQRQRKRLWRVIGQDVLHLDGVRPYVHDLVAPVHDVAFLGNEDVLTLGEKDPLVAILATGKAIELQRDRRGRGRRLHDVRLLIRRQRFGDGRFFRLRAEDVAPGSLIRYIFTGLKQVE